MAIQPPQGTFQPLLPNIFGPSVFVTEDEMAHVRSILNDPLVRKVIVQHLRAEYQQILERNPLKLEAQALLLHHSYLAGAYSLARNLLPNINQAAL